MPFQVPDNFFDSKNEKEPEKEVLKTEDILIQTEVNDESSLNNESSKNDSLFFLDSKVVMISLG